jgi:hypothetical protein
MHMCRYMYTFIYIYIYEYIHMYTYIYIYIYIIYIHIYMHLGLFLGPLDTPEILQLTRAVAHLELISPCVRKSKESKELKIPQGIHMCMYLYMFIHVH